MTEAAKKLGAEPAFPSWNQHPVGMNLRTWLAGMAMQGVVSNAHTLEAVSRLASREQPNERATAQVRTIAIMATSYADALLEELAKEKV